MEKGGVQGKLANLVIEAVAWAIFFGLLALTIEEWACSPKDEDQDQT